MTEALSYYQQQAKSIHTKTPLMAELRQAGISSLSDIGFPVKSDEDWKYTSVEPWLQQRYIETDTAKTRPILDIGLSESFSIAIIDGEIQYVPTDTPEGIVMQSLIQAVDTEASWVTEHLGKILETTHGFQALNSAMMCKGLALYVPDNTHIKIPVYLAHWQSENEQSVHLRHLVVLGENASLTLIEDFSGVADKNYFTNTITEIHLADGAHLEHYKIQRESRQATHIGHMAVRQYANSHLSHHSLSLGGRLVRSDVRVDFRQEKGSCLLNGVYLPFSGQHMDHHVSCMHYVPSCSSEQDYKGILDGKSRAVFNGKVYVEKNAQHTHSQQQNKNLLLSAQAEIDTKPQLEIFADDVVCAHGATVGQLDEDASFYLRTRGINAEQARQLLIHAFAIENFKRMSHQGLAQWMMQLLNQQME